MAAGQHPAATKRPRRRLRVQLHPAQVIVLGFAGAVSLGTLLLMLPIATAGPGGTGFVSALFHATSAVCVTGLSAFDTGAHWTGFGQAVLLVLVQVGGFGIMTFATILGLVVARRIGLRARMQAARESNLVDQTDLRRVLWGVAKISFAVEAVLVVLLTLRWWLGYDETFIEALWLGVFHAVCAFNNAGFALWGDSLVRFASDPFICVPIAVGVIIGGLGFPVLMELRRELRNQLHWSLNTKMVVAVSLALFAGSAVFVTMLEWSNPKTLGALDPPARILAGFFQGVMPRSGGFNSVNTGDLEPTTLFGMDILMFIGAGPASTGGGIKVTTFAVLVFIVYTEVRGEGAVNAFGKRLPRSAQRQAITVVALASGMIALGTMALMVLDDFGLEQSLFEVTSAFTTTGLSTGVTADLSPASQLLMVFLMFAGRLGPVTLASAIALRRTSRLYEYPKERPIIG